MKLSGQIPLLLPFIFFLTGLFFVGVPLAGYFLGLLLFPLALLGAIKYGYWKATLLGVVFFLQGFGLAWIHEVPETNNLTPFVNCKILLEGEVVSPPRKGKKQTSFIIDAKKVQGETLFEVAGKINVTLWDTLSDVKMGDYIKSEFYLKVHSNPNSGYTKYLLSQGVEWKASTNNLLTVGHSQSIWLNFNLIRANILNLVKKRGLIGEEFQLFSAMSLGEKTKLSREIKTKYSLGGLSHCLAISGMHIGIFIVLLQSILNLLTFKGRFEKLKNPLILLFLLTFVLLTGASSAVCRAGFMFSIGIIGKSINRTGNSINSLLFAAFVLLVGKPELLFSVSFQLSFVAMLGIFTCEPFFRSSLNFLPGFIASTISMSLSAQLFTAPLIIFHFGSFPTYFLLSNLLVLPFLVIAIYLSISLLFLSWIPFVGELLCLLFEKTIYISNTILDFILRFPHPKIDFQSESNFFWLICSLHVLVLIICPRIFSLHSKNRKPTRPDLKSIQTKMA